MKENSEELMASIQFRNIDSKQLIHLKFVPSLEMKYFAHLNSLTSKKLKFYVIQLQNG